MKVTFELFLASLLQSVKQLDSYQREENDRLITKWYTKLNSYISEQINPRKNK